MMVEEIIKDLQNSSMRLPVGIVLCGGDSSRMQLDKALIEYHGVPQWKFVYNLLTPFCESVCLSLNEQQASDWDLPNEMEVVEDAEAYLNHGPITGLLSVLSKVENTPVFLVACDYPLLQMENLLDLYKRRSADKQVVCFKNKDRPEPLVSIFELSAYPDLHTYFESGEDSLSKFIRESNTAYIDVSDPGFLRNVNNPEELKLIKTHLKND